MNKDEMMFQKRLVDLSNVAYRKGIPVFTDFLSMNEQSLLHSIRKSELGTNYLLFGGYEFAERQMAMFVPDALFYDVPYPIRTIKITSRYPKFAEKLNHRDYLGALLHLGVDRSKLGDIIVKQQAAYLFCEEKLTPYFMEELTTVKHTVVDLTLEQAEHLENEIEYQELKGTVASLRVDNIAALACHQSRSSILELFRSQKIFINGKLTESNSVLMNEEDILSIRGTGRFVLKEVLSKTKKDRIYIRLLKYGS